MTFIRAKEIPPGSGNWYDYEVETIHEGGRVIQKHIRYLGRHGTAYKPSGLRRPSHALLNINRSVLQSPTTKSKVVCKFCNSQNTRKYGFSKGIQSYFCNDCRTKFTGTDALAHGKVSPSFIADALEEYYGGMSFHEIEHKIDRQTSGDISHTAVIKWVNKYTNEAIRQTKDLHPQVGNKWVADETYIQTDIKTTDPKGVVFWDIIDADTRFLLASRITTTRGTQDAKQLMELASKRAGKTPKVVITDKLAAYIDGIELAYGSDAKHRQGSPFGIEHSTALIERFHNTLKDRTKIMRDLRDKSTLKRFTDGYLVHYNFFRPNMALDNKTPAEVAGLKYENHSWTDVVGVKKVPIARILKPEIVPVESA
jgi:transposase-like protein/ribosomal protein L37AE/L43A